MFDTNEIWEKFILSWQLVIFTSTKNEYKRRFHELIVEYHAYDGAFDYIRNAWLNNYKKKNCYSVDK